MCYNPGPWPVSIQTRIQKKYLKQIGTSYNKFNTFLPVLVIYLIKTHTIFTNKQKSDGLKLKKYEYVVLEHYELIISYYYYLLAYPVNQQFLPTTHIDTSVYKQNQKLLNINARRTNTESGIHI